MKLGDVFGKLTVIQKGVRGSNYWVVRCECGKEKEVHGSNLRRNVRTCGSPIHIDEKWIGRSAGRLTVKACEGSMLLCDCLCGNSTRVSKGNFGRCIFGCGCIRNEMVAARNTTHGFAKNTSTPKMKAFWECWRGMKSRCTHKSRKDFKHYGGRGITFDQRYKSFEAFKVDFFESFEVGLEIERKEVNGNYTKDNIIFITHRRQLWNMRKTWKVEFRGEIIAVQELAERFGIPFPRLRSRIHHQGMTVEEAVSKPSRYSMSMVGVKRPKKKE